jgi:hypothetical protein
VYTKTRPSATIGLDQPPPPAKFSSLTHVGDKPPWGNPDRKGGDNSTEPERRGPRHWLQSSAWPGSAITTTAITTKAIIAKAIIAHR